MKKRARLRKTACILLFVCLSCTFVIQASAAQAEQTQKVRVGFFAFDGYHMIDSQGRRSGYGYDFLQYLARYTNFYYEYVGYDKSWREMQDMLERGEIDLLTSAQKTKDRLERFDFSDDPIGYSAVILTVKAGDNRYVTEEYSQLNGIRIGMLEGSSRNENLTQFALQNHFSYQPVYYDSIEEMEQALQQGKQIDAILTSNLRKTQKEWIIATFDNTPYYIMVKKGNSRLLEQINDAVEKLRDDQKDLESVLFEKYYRVESPDEIAYTAKERLYIQEWQKSGQKIRVTINSEREPVSYFKDGEASGIISEIAKVVFNRTGIPYELIATPPSVDARQLLINGDADVRFDGMADFYDAEEHGLRATDPYLELTLSNVTRRNFSGIPESVAVIQNSDVVEEYVKRIYDESVITRYSCAEECIEAVLSGRKDVAFFQTYIAQRLVNDDVQSRLKEQLVPGYGMNFAVSVTKEEPLLFSIINKSVLSLNNDEINQIIMEQTLYLSNDISVLGYLYQHPMIWILMLTAVAVAVILFILYVSRQKNLRLERERTREFERFISYVCRANNNVIEINAANGKCTVYQVENGKVLFQEKYVDAAKLRLYGLHPEDEERVERLTEKENIQQLIDTVGMAYFECRIKNEGEKQYKWFSFTLQGVSSDEVGAGSLMVFIRDIDQTKKEEEKKREALEDALAAARQASEARGLFLSRMSHEIRTPLNAIIGYVNIAASNLNNPDKAGECLNKSGFAARQLLNIVNDVLDISAMESGKMKIAYEEFNIKQLLTGITSIFHAQAAHKGVQFHVHLNKLMEENLIGDQFRLNQILMNLLSNAVKFTPKGGCVTLTIFQKAVVGKSVYLQFEVEDTGIGMSEDYKKRLFQPFEQQDASTARKFGGTGLGLSITHNLVSMMNGTINVRTQEGKGTKFVVNLSLDVTQEKKISEEEDNFSDLKLMILYDKNNDHRNIRYLLDYFGVVYHVALDCEEALQMLKEQRAKNESYDLCLIDWDISYIGGKEAAEKLRAAAPQGMALFAVGYDISLLPKEASLVDGVIQKPVFQSSLRDVLSELSVQILKKEDPAMQIERKPSGVKILLVEDNELNMDIAGEILTEQGYMVDGARNGLEAAENFEQSSEGEYKAILMDIQMPVMNGYESAKRIRSCSHPQAGTIPIIALTADAFTEDINRALAAGMNGHVSKPVDFGKLCNILSDFISESIQDKETVQDK